jgi:hypothetical protein
VNEESLLQSDLFGKGFLAVYLFFLVVFFTFHLSGNQGLRPFSGGGHVAELSRWNDPGPPAQEEDELDLEMVVEDVVPLHLSGTLDKMSMPYHPIIVAVANRYEVDAALVKAIIMAESSYNPQAVSSEGATGLMQLMPQTAEALGVEDAFDPEHNINGGVKYFKELLKTFDNNVPLALAAYNAGGAVVRRHQGIPPIKATQDYIKKVLGYYRYYQDEATGATDSV